MPEHPPRNGDKKSAKQIGGRSYPQKRGTVDKIIAEVESIQSNKILKGVGADAVTPEGAAAAGIGEAKVIPPELKRIYGDELVPQEKIDVLAKLKNKETIASFLAQTEEEVIAKRKTLADVAPIAPTEPEATTAKESSAPATAETPVVEHRAAAEKADTAKVEKTPEEIAEQNRLQALGVPKEFEEKDFEKIKLSYDPLHKLIEKIANDPEISPDLIKLISPQYNLVVPGDKPGHVGVKLPNNYHDLLKQRAEMSDEFRKENDEKRFDWKDWRGESAGTWGKMAIFMPTDFWKHLNDPNDKLSKYKKESQSLISAIENEQLPDEYANAVARGEILSASQMRIAEAEALLAVKLTEKSGLDKLKQNHSSLWETERNLEGRLKKETDEVVRSRLQQLIEEGKKKQLEVAGFLMAIEKKINNKFKADRNTTDEEISAEFEVPVSEIQKLRESYRRYVISAKILNRIRKGDELNADAIALEYGITAEEAERDIKLYEEYYGKTKTPQAPLEDQTKKDVTPGESRSTLRNLVGRLTEMAGAAGEFVSERYKKSKEFLGLRSSKLDEKLKEKIGDKNQEDKTTEKTTEKAEKFKKYFASRSNSLGEKAKNLGKATGENLLKAGEWYRKLPLKYKIGVSAALIGTTVLTGGANTLVTLITSSAMLGQRLLNALATYVLVEGIGEKVIAKGEKRGAGYERDIEHTIAKHFTSVTAALAVFTGIPGYALKESFEAAGGGRLIELLGGMLGHDISGSKIDRPETKGLPDKPAVGSAGQQVAPPVPDSAAAASAERVADSVQAIPEAPEVASVEATKGQGYERMMEKLLKSLPGDSDFPSGSPMRELLDADPKSLNTVLHRIAEDNGWFNKDGTSIRINIGDKMTVDANGDIWLGDTILAPGGAPTTTAYSPEAPSRPDVSMRAEPTSPHDVTRIDADETDDILTVKDPSSSIDEKPSVSVEKVDSQTLIARLENAQSPAEARSVLDTLFNNDGISRESVEAAIRAAPQMSADPELIKIIEPNTGTIPGPAVFLGQDGGLTVYGAAPTGDTYTVQRTLAERFAALYGQPVKVLLPGGEPGYEIVSPSGKVTIEKPPFINLFSSYKAPLPVTQSVYAFPR